MPFSRFGKFFCLIILIATLLTPFAAQGQKTVREIHIHSGWGGLGAPQHADVTILRENGVFVCDGNRVPADKVKALVAALVAPAISKPEMENLGITPAWLRSHLAAAQQAIPGGYSDATANQKKLFADSFTSSREIARVMPELFSFSSFDDNPGARVEVVFDDGSKVTAKSNSYYVFMIPWERPGGRKTYNADISRAVAALMPEGMVNKERMSGKALLSSLVQSLMQEIELKWNLQGAEDRAGDALAALRGAYAVEQADINPYHDVYFGRRWSENGPHEANLHLTLHKTGLPSNFKEDVVLLYDNGETEGVGDFLKNAGKYEKLVLSVPWLNEYLRKHPEETLFLIYVHDKSLGDHAMRSFARDMKARGREDLIPIVRAQQKDVALLKIGYVYWILFPDKHMMLWRFEGPRGFLKWTESDFAAGRCDEYYAVNNGGCSGREVTADGTLESKPPPRDEACVAAFRKQQGGVEKANDMLFPVMDNGRGGYVDQAGNVRIPLCFDAVGDFSDGLARFERDGLWGYIDKSATVVIQPKFPWADDFSEGLARVQVTGTVLGYDGRWGFIDKMGNVVVKPVYLRSYDEEQDEAFHDGLAKVEVKGKTGYIDQTGRMVIPPEFSYAYPFSEGVAAATKSEDGESGWGYIDKSGKWMIAPKFDWASSFNEHLAPVNRRHDCGYVDKTGAYALRPPVSPDETDCFSVWGEFADGLSRWKIGKKYGFIDRTGKMVIAPQFDLTFHFSEGLAAVMIGGKWGYIDTKGKMVIEPRVLARAEDFHHGVAEVSTKDGKWGYIDRSGKYIWEPTLQGAPTER